MFSTVFRKSTIILTATSILAALTGCSAQKPTTAQAETVAACVIKNAAPERLRAMGESYALSESTGLAHADAWDCPEGRWGVALSPSYRKSVEPQVAAALLKSAPAREGMYAGTFGRQFSAKQRAVMGKLGMFFDGARRAALQGLTCGTIDAQSAQVVGRLDLAFSTAVLGIQGNIAEPQIAQRAADKLLDRVNLLIPAQASASCAANDGKAEFTEYARQMHQFYTASHPWAPGCGVRQEGEEFTLVCSGVKPTTQAGNTKAY